MFRTLKALVSVPAVMACALAGTAGLLKMIERLPGGMVLLGVDKTPLFRYNTHSSSGLLRTPSPGCRRTRPVRPHPYNFIGPRSSAG